MKLRAALLSLAAVLLSSMSVAAQREAVDMIVTGGTVVTMDAARNIYDPGAVAIRNHNIVGVGPAEAIARKYRSRRTMSVSGRLVMPGLINAHTHAPMTLFRGLADDLTLQEWLEKYIFPAEAKNVNPDFVLWGTRLACLEMIRGGTTTFADMYYFEDQVAQAAKDAGIRVIAGQTILDFPAPDYKTVPEALRGTEAFLKKWAFDSLVRPAVGPHAIYTNSAETLRASAELAKRYSAPLLIHLEETQREVEEARAKYQKTPVEYLESLGVLSDRVLAAHCVWASPGDIALLRKYNVGVAHNPSSNMKLGSGIAPVTEMLAAGVNVGLGTDGAASNNDLNMFEEMDVASKLHKIGQRDPRALPAETAIALATIGGARALGMEKEIGSLEAGKKADLIILRTDRPHAVPLYNVYSHIVYALKASDVESVIVDGQKVMDHGRVITLDEVMIREKAREYAKRVKESVGMR